MLGKILWGYLFVILHPSYWTSDSTIDRQFDKKLLELLDKGEKMKIISSHYVKLGPYELWCANHPYSSYTLRSNSSKIPSRYTRHLLNKAYLKALDSEEL